MSWKDWFVISLCFIFVLITAACTTGNGEDTDGDTSEQDVIQEQDRDPDVIIPGMDGDEEIDRDLDADDEILPPCQDGEFDCSGTWIVLCDGGQWQQATNCADFGEACDGGICVSIVDGDEDDIPTDGDTTDGDEETDIACYCPVFSGLYCIDPNQSNPANFLSVNVRILNPGCTLALTVMTNEQVVFDGEVPCGEEGLALLESLDCSLERNEQDDTILLTCEPYSYLFSQAFCEPDGDIEDGDIDLPPKPSQGEVIFTEFMADPVNSTGDWLEVYNTTDSDRLLGGLKLCPLQDADCETLTDGLVIGGHETMVMANFDDIALNGGIANVATTFTFNLDKNGDKLRLYDIGGGVVLIDQVDYRNFTIVEAVAMQLTPDTYDSVLNDLSINWCQAYAQYDAAGPHYGTPGEMNPSCVHPDGDVDVDPETTDGDTDGDAPDGDEDEDVDVSTNRPPQLLSIDPITMDVNEVRQVTLVAADQDDGQTLTFCKASGPGWAVVEGTGPSPGPINGTLRLTPGGADAGEFSVMVRIIDGGTCDAPTGLYDEKEARVSVGQGALPNGASCLEANRCESRYCVDGVCCEDICSGICKSCNLPGTEGECEVVIDAEDDPQCMTTQFCNASGQCKKFDGQPCFSGTECASGQCREDYDGNGRWCALNTQCVHNGQIYTSGQYSPDCSTIDNRMLCQSGIWMPEACPIDTECSTYYCNGGICQVQQAATTKRCSSTYSCSPAEGDNKYALGGDLRCQGYCDGAGNCDWAGNCSDCGAADGWYDTGDSGPGCADLLDPVAKYRDYTCTAGACSFTNTQTVDCNTQDDFTGGGNDPGCGDDPPRAQRDYYADEEGNCVFTSENCAEVSCDDQDDCTTTCDGTAIKASLDYYVDSVSGECVSATGSIVEDCADKDSEDSDGGPEDWLTGGIVKDYENCSNGECTFTTVSDYCVGNALNEYGAGGSGVVGPTLHDCEANETLYCKDTQHLYRNEWNCIGNPGYCSDGAQDTQVEDCGVNGCGGVCGSGANGCTYHERGCVDNDCQDVAHDLDDNSTYCSQCSGVEWAIGGEVSASTCCGDDSGEYNRSCIDSSANGNCGNDTKACCDGNNDCVDHLGNCISTGGCDFFGENGSKSFCNNRNWEDPDENDDYCTAAGCDYTWLSYASASNQCCGDDSGEDIEQPQLTGRSCCYNGVTLPSGTASGSIICFSGQLFNCTGLATDESGISDAVDACTQKGDLFCRSNGTWAATQENSCDCTSGSDCQSGYCKADHDYVGAWCGESSQCAHDGTLFSDGQYSSGCKTDQAKAICDNGVWSEELCGTNTVCTTHTCVGGECGVTYKNTTVQCNPTYDCASGPGDTNYHTSGDYRCQAYCDGAGNCDYAGSCQNCQDEFPSGDGTCQVGQCVLADCEAHTANCDGNEDNGCEIDLTHTQICEDPTLLQNICGDHHNGTLCLSKPCNTGDSISGRGSRWVRVRIEECSNCPETDLRIRARLTPPADADYDLYLYRPCGTERAKSENPGSQVENVTSTINDQFTNDDSDYFYIEIRHKGGASCENWILETKGGCKDGW